MARSNSVGGLVKATTGLIAQVPGGEKLVLQAVKDLLDELRDTRRQNASLKRENERLKERVTRLTTPSRRSR